MSDCRNPHLSAYDRAAQEDMERSRAADSREKIEEDSQEKIDADLRGLLLLLVNDVANTAYEQTFDKHLIVDTWWNAFVRITDRQAAITTQECTDVYETGCEACRRAQKREIAELQAKVDGLEAENARLRSRMSDDAEYGRLVMDAYRELRAKLDAIREAVGESKHEEIVRCRDCKYCEPIRSRRIGGLKCVANSESVSVEPDGFCAWGEPREVADE